MALILVCVALLLSVSTATTVTTSTTPTAAVAGLISRILDDAPTAAAFHLDLDLSGSAADAPESFTISTTSTANSNSPTTAVTLRGSTGVALASAFHHYLRFYCNASVAWGRNRTGIQLGAAVSQPLPLLAAPITVRFNSEWRYYLNFCTTSYTFAFSSKEDWLEEVDWMALHGINMPLATAGTEYVLGETFGPDGFGLTETEITEFFPGEGERGGGVRVKTVSSEVERQRHGERRDTGNAERLGRIDQQ